MPVPAPPGPSAGPDVEVDSDAVSPDLADGTGTRSGGVVTLRDIARATGLSKPTVTKILGGKESHLFRPATRDRVLEAARKLGYRANSAARAIGTGRFGCVALVLSARAGRSDLPMDLLAGIVEELNRHNLHLTITHLPDEQLTAEGFVPKVLRENMADGMIINYTHDIPQAMLDLIHAHHAPAVWVNTRLGSNCVHPDDRGGMRALVEHLLSLGHRKVEYVMFDTSTHYSRGDRQAGYCDAMKAAGLEPRVFDREVPSEGQVEKAREVLSRPDRPTAVVCRPEDAPTFAYVAASLGLEVPADLSLACVASWHRVLLGRPMTLALLPAADQGRRVVDMLLQKVRDPHRRLPEIKLPFRLFGGGSAAPPRA